MLQSENLLGTFGRRSTIDTSVKSKEEKVPNLIMTLANYLIAAETYTALCLPTHLVAVRTCLSLLLLSTSKTSLRKNDLTRRKII